MKKRKSSGRPKVYTKKRYPIRIYLERPMKRELQAICFVEEKSINQKVTELIAEEINQRKIIGLDKTTRIFSGPVTATETSAAQIQDLTTH